MKNIRVIASGVAAATLLIGGVAFAQSASFSSEMGIGSQGAEVTSLQTWLTHYGYYNGPVTGYFGTLTQAGVEKFQAANDISATGFVGPLTLAALNSAQANETGSVSGTTTANSTTIAQLEAELNSLLAQIQTLEGNTTVTTTSSTAPMGQSTTLSTNENVSVGATLGASGTSPYTYSIATNPLDGTITSFNPSTGAFTYSPNNDYTGTDSFSYTVTNSAGVSAPVTVTLNVQPGTATSGVPTGEALSFSTSDNAAYNGTLSASGNSPYTYSITTEPTHGTISNFNSSTGSFTYTPAANYSGSDSFTYTASNSYGVSSPVTVTVNDGSSSTTGAPTGQTYSFSTSNGAALNGTLSASGTGPYTYAIVTNPSYGSLINFNPSTGTFTYIPNSGYTGNDSFTYTVSNGTATSSAYTVNLTD